MTVLYYIQKEYRTELVADFRSFYHTSFYEMKLDEALELIPALLRKSESLFSAKWHRTEPFSAEARLLQSVQNAVIASIQTKKGQEWKKKDMLIQLPAINTHSFTLAEKVSIKEVEKRWADAGWGKLNEIYKEKNKSS